MQDLNDKLTGDNLTAAEWNEVPSELQNVIENTGQALSGGDLNQLGKGVAQYAANGNFYTDSGAGNAYVLTQIGLKQSAPAYADGMAIEFVPANTNTGSASVNVAGLGVKNISNTSSGGEIISGTRISMRYNVGTGEFEIFQTAATPVTAGTLFGLTLSNDTDTDHDISIAVGECADSTNAFLLELSSLIVKQIDAAWAAGNNAGGLFSGSVAIDTWYHLFLIRKDSDGSIDAGFDTSVTAANIPGGYTAYRRIGSVLTDGSANILPFTQVGNDFDFNTQIQDYNAALPTGSRTTVTISTPLGVVTKAKIQASVNSVATVSVFILVTPLNAADVVADPSAYTVWHGDATTGYTAGSQAEIIADANSQIGIRGSHTSNGSILTNGWIDNRGQY